MTFGSRILRTALWLLLVAVPHLTAVPVERNATQEAASHQVQEWQHQTQQAIDKIIGYRQSGCTSKDIVYRREW